MTPLAIYIHWPFCKSKCPYCDFNSHVREQVEQERWKNALLRELEFMAAHVPDRTVGSIFFGGGTPSLMPPETVAALIERVKNLWPESDNVEITLEANPTSIEAGRFAAFKDAGVNRVSIGVQSLDEQELKFLGREHSAREALHAIDLAAGIFPRYSFDLIYARPNQTLAAWRSELSEALTHVGGHLSLYQLTIEENTAFHHAYAKHAFTLPDEIEAEALYRTTEEMMNAQGFSAYEVSNYAKPGQESRHNLSYWKSYDYIGIGPGAHGRISNSFTRIATQTIKSPERWLTQMEAQGNGIEIWQELTRQEIVEERLMMGLRLSEGIDAKEFESSLNIPLSEFIDAKKHALYRQQGLLEDRDDKLVPTLKGRLVLNRLLADLLPA